MVLTQTCIPLVIYLGEINMPVVGIVVSYVGASMGTAAFAGTALASFGSAIGAGIAGGLYASSQGGDFGKGFLMGAVGNYIGGQLGDVFGGAAGTADDAFMAADAAQLAEQGLSAGAIGQNMGAAAGNWGGVNIMSGMGDVASGASTGMGELSNIVPVSGEMSLDDELTNAWGIPSTGNPMEIEITHGMPTQDASPYGPVVDNASQSSMGPWEPAGTQNSGVTTWGFDDAYENPLATTNTQTPPTLQDIVATPELKQLDNITGGNPAGEFGTPTQSGGYMDRLKGWVSDTDANLAKYGMPKGSTILGLAGMGQYMMGNYETYKAEQIAKGMKPLTLEEFQNKMYNSNDYKTVANSQAKSGRTGTLPALLARMKQQSSMDYTKNYQPTANQNWWNINANISNQKMNNLGNLTQPLSMAWAMNRGKR